MRKLIAMGLACLRLTGCHSTKYFVLFEKRQVQTISEAREGTILMLQNWKFRSGVIHGALKGQMDILPLRAVEAIEELDKLAGQIDVSDDRALGYALGLRISMLRDIVKTALKQYAPNILKYITF